MSSQDAAAAMGWVVPDETPAFAPLSGQVFVGRRDEVDSLIATADAARAGRAQTVVIHGQAGVGKSALVARVAADLTDVTSVRVRGATTRALPPLGVADRLLQALTGGAAEPLAGYSPAAAGGRIIEAIGGFDDARPLMLHLDDMHAWDRESTEAILFAQRRLLAEPVLLVLSGHPEGSAWSPSPGPAWSAGTERMSLGGLTVDDIGDLVDALGMREPWTTAESLAAATGGNPLHLAALLAASPPARARLLLAEGSATPMGRLLAERVTGYGPAAWHVAASLAVAGSPLDLDGVRRASAVAEAEHWVAALRQDGIIDLDTALPDGIWFSSDAYAAAVADALDPADLATCHRQLSAVTTGFERLQHRVIASEDYDEGLVEELVDAALAEGLAGRTERAARLRLWASQLTRRPESRARLACEAIRSFVVAAEESQALALAPVLSQLPQTPSTSETQAALSFAKGQLASAREELLVAIDQIGRDTEGEASIRLRLGLAYVDCLLAAGDEAAQAARYVLDRGTDLIQPTALAFLALATALSDGPSRGLELLVGLPDSTTEVTPQEIPALVVRGQLRALTGNLDGAMNDLSAGVRRRGTVIGRVLGLSAYVHLAWAYYFAGSWEAANRTLDVAEETSHEGARRFDQPILRSLSAILAAGSGDEAKARLDVEQAERLAAGADFDGPSLHVALARAAIAQALDRPEEVVEQLSGLRPPRIERDRHRLNAVLWLPALVDARVSIGDVEVAKADLAELTELIGADAEPVGDTFESGLAVALAWARGRVLEGCGEDDAATQAYALGLHVRCPNGEPEWYRAHTRASYGRLLLVRGLVADGAAALGRAEQSFRAMGATAFADRCADELTRGQLPSPKAPDWMGVLTPRERETAELVARGWTNKEIADHQYVSPKTVEYHLRNTYIKLDITSRRELRDMLQARSPLGE